VSPRPVGTWESIEPGDWILFYFDRHFPLCGRVLVSERSPLVAERLWGSDDGGTWEYLYLVDEIREVGVPRPLALETLGYNESFYPRGFIRVNRDLEGAFGSVEQLLEILAGTGHSFRRAVDAARAGDEGEAVAILDQIDSGLSEKSIAEAVAGYATSDPPEVREAIVKRVLRNRKLAIQLKALYEGRSGVWIHVRQARWNVLFRGRPYQGNLLARG
jgi:hypothetical protein